MVTVTSGTPKSPSVFPLIQCGSETGDMITLGCLATEFRPSTLTYRWNKNGASVDNFVQYPSTVTGEFYTGISQLSVKRQDWEKNNFTCVAEHSAGNTEIPIPQLKEFFQKPSVRVLVSSAEEQEIIFSCFAKDFSPKVNEFKWFKNSKEVTAKISESNTPIKEESRTSDGNILYSAASFLTVASSEWRENDNFTCQFKGRGENKLPMYESGYITYQAPTTSVCPITETSVTIKEPTLKDIFLNRRGKITCQVTGKGMTEVDIWWENESGKIMIPSAPLAKSYAVASLSLDITYDEWSQGVKHYCFIEHKECLEPIKKEYERRVGETLRPSVFMLSPVEHTRKDVVTLACYVKDFFPKEVYVSWLVNDEEIENTKFHTTTAEKYNGAYVAYGHLMVPLDEWKEKDAVFSCLVHHESMINTTRTVVRSIGYRDLDQTNIINLDLTIPEKCKAK